jgi:hypothetical protein
MMLSEGVSSRVDEAVKKILDEEEKKTSSSEDEPSEKIEESVDDEPISVDKLQEEEVDASSEMPEEEMVEEKEEKVELDLDEPAEEEEVEEVPSEKELSEVYKKVMAEVTVAKLPPDVQSVEKEADAKEMEWTDAEAEDKKVFAMKESKTLKKLLAIHRNTVRENHSLRNLVQKLVNEMKEVNLFNQKLVQSRKLVSEHSLNDRDYKAVLAKFDSAKSITEVNAIYNAFSSAFRMNESKVTSGIARKVGNLSRSVIKESRDNDRTGERGDSFARMNELAGIKE